MKRFFAFFIVFAILTACIKDDLRQMHKEIEALREVTVAQLSVQASNIGTSIADLEDMSTTLNAYIAELDKSTSEIREKLSSANAILSNFRTSYSDSISHNEKEFIHSVESMDNNISGHIAQADSTIETLKSRDASLDAKVSALRSYADSLFTTKDWANGTLATLDKQNEILSDIESIKGSIAILEEASVDFNKLLEKFIDETVNQYRDKFNGQIASEVEALTKSYTEAAGQMKNLINEESSKAIMESIAKNEEKLMDWVNDKLTAYLTVEEARARVEAFNALMGNLPEGKSFLSGIDSLYDALDKTSLNVTEAYKEAISDAIKNHEGKMSESMAEKLSLLHTGEVASLEQRANQIDTDIEKLYQSIVKLDSRIKSIEEQAEAVNEDLEMLQELQDKLEQYIGEVKEALQKADAEDRTRLKGLISELNKLNNDISAKITELRNYVGTIPQGNTSVKQWVETSVESLKHQFESYYTIEQIDFFVDSLNKALAPIDSAIADHTTRIDSFTDSINLYTGLLETELKEWVNKALTDNYINADSTKFHLDSLELLIKGMFTTADSKLLDSLNQVQKDLDKAIAKLTEKYEKAIKDAVENEDGYVTAKILSDLDKANKEIDNIKARVPAFCQEVTALKGRMTQLETDIKHLLDSLGKISNDFDLLVKDYEHSSLKDIESAIYARLKACRDHLNSSADTLAAITDTIYGAGTIKSQIEALAHLADDMALATRQIDTLSSFFGGYLDTTTLSKVIASVRTKINNCAKATKMSALNDSIASLNALQSRIIALETAYSTAETDLGKLNTFFGNITGKTFESIIAAVEEDIAKMALITDLDELTQRVNDLDTSFMVIVDRLDFYTKQVDTLQQRYAEFSEKINAISLLIGTLKLDISNYSFKEGTNLSAIATTISQRAQSIKDLRDKLSGAFTRIEQVQKSVDSLGGDSKVVAALEELFKRFDDEIKEFLPKGAQDGIDLTSRFSEIGTLTDNVNIIVHDIDSIQKAIAQLEASAKTLSDSTDFMDILVTEIKNSLVEYVLSANLTDTFNLVKNLMPYIAKTDSLAKELIDVESTISTLDSFFKTYYEGESITTLKDLLKVIHSTLDSLEKEEIHGGSSSTPLQDRITSIKTTLDDLVPRVDSLAAEVAAWSLCNRFTTVTYVPKYFDHAERQVNGGFSFDFLIFPEDVATLLTKAESSPYIRMIIRGGDINGVLDILSITQDEGNKNKITIVTEGTDEDDVSAALHVEIKDKYGYVTATFTSDYIGLVKR